MILIDKMKNMKIYKTQMFLPTLANDKKKQSAIFLLTPNYTSSKSIMNSNLFVNKLRYSSYYLERNLSYYIDSKYIEDTDEDLNEIEENYNYQCLTEMKAAQRNALPDSEFGIPDKRKFPLDTAARVRSAIKFFNYANSDEEEGLARKIKAAMKKFNIDDVEVSKKNRFSKYYKSAVKEDTEVIEEKSDNPYTSEILAQLNERDSLKVGDRIFIFEDVNRKYDTRLRTMLYKSRVRRAKDIAPLYDTVKMENPFIKYTFFRLEKYVKKNLFYDLYYYQNAFFANNNWTMQKGFDLYTDFLNRLLNDEHISSFGYTNKTVFIPVIDWDRYKDASVWNFRKNLNPISVIYQLLYTNNKAKLVDLFGNKDIIFVGINNYFKFNFKDPGKGLDDYKRVALKFKTFVMKMCRSEEFDLEDVDTTADNAEDKEVIKIKVADKLDVNKGIDITPQLYISKDKRYNDLQNNNNTIAKALATTSKSVVTPKPAISVSKAKKDIENNNKEEEKQLDMLAANDPKRELKDKEEEAKKQAVADIINTITNTTDVQSEEELIDKLDDTQLMDLLMNMGADDADKVDISDARSSRISELDQKLLDSKVNGKRVKDILEEKPPEREVTKLNIGSVNDEWKELSYMNFDKNYDIDKDIIACFRKFSTVSRPISIRNIDVQNTSTSEDRVNTYTVEMEDYRGKRFTVKLDIPIMEDNRFLLRGNNKSIQSQLYNMPILKTEVDTCQIVSNYMKIIIYRARENGGRSLPNTTRFLKAINKYKGDKIKITRGNCRKICGKYELPMDYISLSEFLVRLDTPDFTIYFNQDEIRSKFADKIDLSRGIPIGYDKKDAIIYLAPDKVFTDYLIEWFESRNYNSFMDLVRAAAKPSLSVYTECKIMSSRIPIVVLCCYYEGLRKTLEKGNIQYELMDKLPSEVRNNLNKDWIKFKDGYVVFPITYTSSLLLNGLKRCETEEYSLADIDNKNMYLEFLDNFGGKIKADGIDNFYDLMVDPITEETLKYYNLPTDYLTMLLYANSLLADNKFYKHTNMASRRVRRYELIAVYAYKALAEAYANYATQLKHSKASAEFFVKQTAVIDAFLKDTITSDDSCINALRDIETTNAVTTKGPSGMNSDRAYSLDKRTYDDSMLNVMGMSTGFAANVGITRQLTLDANIEGERGYVKSINGNTSKMNTTKTLTATEALTPFGCNRDDPMRTAMTFIQTSKHMVNTEKADPLLVTNGADEALVYMASDNFAFKAKKDGVVKEVNDKFIIVEYTDKTHDFINLEQTIEKNSDGGYYVPLKKDIAEGIKPGTRFSKGKVLAYDKQSFSNSMGEDDNLAYNIGKLAKVAVLNMDDGFEDSGIVTEKLAEDLSTRINLMFDRVIDKNANILSIKNVGDSVEVGDNLITWQDPFEDEDTNILLKNLTATEVSELGKKSLKSELTGVITDIKMYRTCDLSEFSESMQKIIKRYEAPYNEMDKIFDKYGLDKSKIRAHYTLPPTGKLKKSQEALLVEFFVEYRDTAGIGDKVVYFAANKAVTKRIIPNELAPYTEFRPNEQISAFVSEVSIDKRMVCSSIVTGSLNKLMVELDRSVKDIMGIPYDDSTI